ncbi:MAG: transcription/translation regulatory transformer protein RfaH [Candidatus Competibacteraceae bacterium]|nr:transcription/translation regulatory transformer protein RfaH [Candidatus Competibacteraceae bacterium]
MTEEVTASPNWYVIQTKPRQGLRAETNLKNQDYTVFYPQMTVERVRRGQRVVLSEPLFPNYIFIQLCRWTDNWHPLRSTRGVARLVSFGNEPAMVPAEVIDTIAARLDQTESRSLMQKGDRVRITNGCFRGLEAIFQAFDGETRVVLLLELLHKQTKLTVPLTDIDLSV